MEEFLKRLERRHVQTHIKLTEQPVSSGSTRVDTQRHHIDDLMKTILIDQCPNFYFYITRV